MKKFEVVPYHDFNRRTCLLVESGDKCKFIPLNSDGLSIHELSSTEFGRIYTPMPKYPMAKAAQIYLDYAKTVGASKDVLKFLGQFVNISDREYDMATKKAAATEAVEKPAKATTAKATTAKATTAKATTAKATTAKATGEKKSSASQMFKDLIMGGKLNDRQIFERAQKAFDLDDNKFSYVNWNYQDLVRKGMNPPELKRVVNR